MSIYSDTTGIWQCLSWSIYLCILVYIFYMYSLSFTLFSMLKLKFPFFPQNNKKINHQSAGWGLLFLYLYGNDEQARRSFRVPLAPLFHVIVFQPWSSEARRWIQHGRTHLLLELFRTPWVSECFALSSAGAKALSLEYETPSPKNLIIIRQQNSFTTEWSLLGLFRVDFHVPGVEDKRLFHPCLETGPWVQAGTTEE